MIEVTKKMNQTLTSVVQEKVLNSLPTFDKLHQTITTRGTYSTHYQDQLKAHLQQAKSDLLACSQIAKGLPPTEPMQDQIMEDFKMAKEQSKKALLDLMILQSRNENVQKVLKRAVYSESMKSQVSLLATDGDLNLLSKGVLKEEQKDQMLLMQSQMDRMTKEVQDARNKAEILRSIGEQTKARIEDEMNKEEKEVLKLAESGAIKNSFQSQPKKNFLAAPNKSVALQGPQLIEKVNQVAAKLA